MPGLAITAAHQSVEGTGPLMHLAGEEQGRRYMAMGYPCARYSLLFQGLSKAENKQGRHYEPLYR